MKSFTSDFTMQSTTALSVALEYLGRSHENWTPFAGGTDLMVLFEAGKLSQGNFLDINKIQELKGISFQTEYVEIGALTTYTDILENSVMQSEFKLMCEAAKQTGAVAIQNRGTIGGNIANGSPAADTPPALLAYDSEIELSSSSGSRWIPYEGFHLGYKKMKIAKNELLTKIRIKRNTKDTVQMYRKVGTRKAQAISKVCFAALAKKENKTISKLRLSYGSVAPVPLRCFKTEQFLEGQALTHNLIIQASRVLEKEISPINDIRSTNEYRKRVAINLFFDFMEGL